MPFCTNCGKEALPTDRFCSNCGSQIGTIISEGQGSGETTEQTAVPRVMGLGRNHVVYLTQDGLLGVKVRSIVTLLLALLLPLPLLAAVYYVFHAGALAVYITAWIASSGLLYDELRWRGIRSLDGNSSGKPLESQASWLIPWHSIRMADWNGWTLWFTSTNPARKASFTFDRGSSPLVERSLDSSGVRYSYKRPRLPRVLTGFWALALILFVLSQSILIFAATLPFFPGEEQMYTTVLNSTRSQVAGASFAEAFRAIYLNNIQVAWGGMLPVLGQLSFGLASYNTGRVLQVIAIGDHIPSSIILVSLYLLPHTWIEESAYPIATVAGLLAVTRWRSVAPGAFTRRQNWGSTKLAQAMGGVALILLAAGLIETLGLYMGFGEVLLWIPVGAGYYLYSRWNRERIRSASQLGSA